LIDNFHVVPVSGAVARDFILATSVPVRPSQIRHNFRCADSAAEFKGLSIVIPTTVGLSKIEISDHSLRPLTLDCY
jgi:hypothetical protein